jgi:hypothetical protein
MNHTYSNNTCFHIKTHCFQHDIRSNKQLMIYITHHKTKSQANNDLDHCTLLFLTLNHMFKIRIAANNAANS